MNDKIKEAIETLVKKINEDKNFLPNDYLHLSQAVVNLTLAKVNYNFKK